MREVQAMLPPEVQDHERVRVQLNAALNAMNSTVDGAPVPAGYAGYAAPAPASSAAAAPGLATSRWAAGAPTAGIAQGTC